MCKFGISRSSRGKAFHNLGAATWKDLSPSVTLVLNVDDAIQKRWPRKRVTLPDGSTSASVLWGQSWSLCPSKLHSLMLWLSRFVRQVYQVSSLFIIYKRLFHTNLTDLQGAKTNRGRSVSQVLKYYRCQKKRLTKSQFFRKKSREMNK